MSYTPTRIIKTDSPEVWEVTKKTLAAGGLVLFCTESTYGIGAALGAGPEVMERLASLKGRDGQKPFPLVGASVEIVEEFCALPQALQILGRACWPGPLTVAGCPRGSVPPQILSPVGTVGVRVSSHPVARRVAELAGGIVTATSANLAGHLPARSVEELGSLAEAVDLILDSGLAPGGPPSSVVGWDEQGLVVYREGALRTGVLEGILKSAGVSHG